MTLAVYASRVPDRGCREPIWIGSSKLSCAEFVPDDQRSAFSLVNGVTGGAEGFEPLTPSMRTRCATGLRHSPSARHRNSLRAGDKANRSGTARANPPRHPATTPPSIMKL